MRTGGDRLQYARIAYRRGVTLTLQLELIIIGVEHAQMRTTLIFPVLMLMQTMSIIDDVIGMQVRKKDRS
jgi:hypothetical protein